MNSSKSAGALGEGQDAAGEASGTSTGSTFFASLSRTLLFIWGMMLKRPSRLFRPSRGASSHTFRTACSWLTSARPFALRSLVHHLSSSTRKARQSQFGPQGSLQASKELRECIDCP